MPSGVVPHYQLCLLVWCLIIGHAFWCGASLSAVPAGVVPHYRACLLVWCLTIGYAFWCGASLSAVPAGVVPHYRPSLLVWYFSIGHAFWCGTSLSCGSISTATNLLLVECRCKKGGHKSSATCAEVPLRLMIWCHSQICLLVKMQLYQICMLCSIIQIRGFVKCFTIR